MPTPRAVLFDLDGVLVDSKEAWFKTVEASGVRYRGSPVTRAEFDPTFGQGTAADAETFRLGITADELDAFYAEEFVRHLEAVWVNPEAAPLFEALHTRGIGRALVTNSVAPVVDAVLAHGKLSLPVRATADRVVHAKPAPDLVLLACRDLNLEPRDVWMVGDSRYDRAAAQSAGVFFVGLGLDADLRIEALAELKPWAT